MKPSYIYSSLLDEHQQLLSKSSLYTGYVVDTYICGCGVNKFLIRDTHPVQYICEECSNEVFLDANLLNDDLISFIHKYYSLDIKFDFKFKYSSINRTMASICTIDIPNGIDFLRNKVYTKELIVNYRLYTANNSEMYKFKFSTTNIYSTAYILSRLNSLIEDSHSVDEYIADNVAKPLGIKLSRRGSNQRDK